MIWQKILKVLMKGAWDWILRVGSPVCLFTLTTKDGTLWNRRWTSLWRDYLFPKYWPNWGRAMECFQGLYSLSGRMPLPQDLGKSRNRKIGCYNVRIILKCDRQRGNAAADVPVKFQSDWKSININRAALRLHKWFWICNQSWIDICLKYMSCLVLNHELTFFRCLRVRKNVGGGMRQAGVLAAACQTALTDARERLHRDHEHTRRLAESEDG